MSLEAIRWAFAQPVKSSAKFVLVAMAHHVEGPDMRCAQSYRALAALTGMDFKTVEASVFRLRTAGFITDTGDRRGETSKVPVYRLNDPKSGVVPSTPEGEGGAKLQHANDPKSGVIKANGNDPVFPGNDPKFPAESPQISSGIPPILGSLDASRVLPCIPEEEPPKKEKKKREPREDAARPTDVSEATWTSWTALRRKKRATVDATVVAMAREQAVIAGVTLDRFFCLWVSRGSQGLQAEWLSASEKGLPLTPLRHANGGKYAAAGRTLFGPDQTYSEVIDVEPH